MQDKQPVVGLVNEFGEPIEGTEEIVDLGPLTIEEGLELKRQAKEVVDRQSDAEVIKQHLEENKEMIINTAKDFDKRFSSNWFDLEKMIKKTRFKGIEDCLQILTLLKLSGHLVAKMVDGIEKYKIVLNNEDKKVILNQRLKELQAEKKLIEQELEQL